MGKREVLRIGSAAACAVEGARILTGIALDAVQERGSVAIALSGGSSPIPLYRELATGAIAQKFPWDRARFFFGDERCVPPDHPYSNFGSAQKNLFDLAPAAPLAVHRIEGELRPEEAAKRYGSLLAEELGDPPVFDAILLGLGRDGHTASLFPGDPALSAPGIATAVSHHGADPDLPRVTLTLRTFNASRAVIFVVSGAGKESMLDRVLLDSASANRPASMVNPPGPVTWLVCP